MLNLPQSLQDQLLDAAKRFATDAQPLSQLLTTMVEDVERVMAEPLEIFPVCHHSPASAFQMVQRLRAKAPKVIYIELCEDLLPMVENLWDCKLPIALQAFASESKTFEPQHMPLSVVAPLTEASAEYQAIAYGLEHPDTELVFVDRAVDFVFQWQGPKPEPETEGLVEEATLHGTAVGIEMGNLTPSFEEFLTFLLRNANTRHFAEWWDQYVEQPLIGADYGTYRQVMVLVGSLMRRLGRRDPEQESDCLRERHMWTRIKQHLQTNQIAPQDTIFICGAFHAIQEVEEFGTGNEQVWEIPDQTETKWLYGLIPSSFMAIEYQFNHPAGTVALAEATWKKSLKVSKLKPFSLAKKKSTKGTKTKKLSPAQQSTSPSTPATSSPDTQLLSTFLTRPPDLAAADTDQLLQWCAEVVSLARKNGYLASTADAIATYQTAILLAHMRNRPHPTPYDFQDAAITCLEKDRTPKKRTIAQVCQILLGGDRQGMVGYASLPPLAQDVYDRLEPLDINLQAKPNQRALMDFKATPELLPCSQVLWRLNYLVGNHLVQPIMGERNLGQPPVQESWEVRIGKNQRSLIMLGYEGVTIEQVLELRLRRAAFDPQAGASAALTTAEDSVLYLQNPRLTQELGEQAIRRLTQETGAEDAPQIFDRVRRLVHYYRTTPTGLPDWIKQFVTTGYSHYTTLLPKAFGDRGTSPEQIAGMLGFIFTLESLALSLGCNRSQLLIGVKQAGQEGDDPAKLGLLWTTEWLLGLRSLGEMREFFDRLLTNPLRIATFPDHLNGFILAFTFAPQIGQFLVELLSQLFGSVPDPILLPCLPNLILRLRSHGHLLPNLIKEAAHSFPHRLEELAQWQFSSTSESMEEVEDEAEPTTLSEPEEQVQALLSEYPATIQAFALLLNNSQENL
jgi:hypothetical protein